MNVWLVIENVVWGDRTQPRVAAETPGLAYAWLAENCGGGVDFEVVAVELLRDVEPDTWDFAQPDGARRPTHRSPIECFDIGNGPYRIGGGTVTITGWISGTDGCICPKHCIATGDPALLKLFADTYRPWLTRVGAEVEA